jgi:hypothetical protein
METLATSAKRSQMRRIGYVALTGIDAIGGGDPSQKVWDLAQSDPRRLHDLVESLPLVADPGVRSSLYEKILPLLGSGSGPSGPQPGAVGRYVRIELPGSQKTLTLAEVEVFVGTENVARTGTATQSATAHGGEASRAIDGNTNPDWGNGSQTHTPENVDNRGVKAVLDAWQAGPRAPGPRRFVLMSSIGVTTFTMPSSCVTSMPSPPNSPRVCTCMSRKLFASI